jgi:hypothetical protein
MAPLAPFRVDRVAWLGPMAPLAPFRVDPVVRLGLVARPA